MPQSFKAKSFISCSHQVLPHCHHFIAWRKKEKEEAIIPYVCVLSLQWAAPWVADGQHCYPHRANTAKDSHCRNIFVCRTAKASRKRQKSHSEAEKPRRAFWPSGQPTRLAQSLWGVFRERRRALGRVQLVLKKSQFSEEQHFSDGNEQFQFFSQQ